MQCTRQLAWLLLATLVCAECAGAASQTAESPVAPGPGPPCDDAAHHQFDFWLGDWQVFDRATSKLMAVDHIEKQFNGCAVVQKMTWLTDQFRRPGADYRLAGMSVNVMRNGHWLTLWVDNTYGGGLVVEGGLQDGSMVLTSPTAHNGSYTRGVWTPNPDGTVRNAGYRSRDGKTNWKLYFDYLYRPNR